MLKFYKITEDTRLTRIHEFLNWLESLPKTKRGNVPYVIGKAIPGTIAFYKSTDAATFVLKFGGRLVTEQEKDQYRRRTGKHWSSV